MNVPLSKGYFPYLYPSRSLAFKPKSTCPSADITWPLSLDWTTCQPSIGRSIAGACVLKHFPCSFSVAYGCAITGSAATCQFRYSIIHSRTYRSALGRVVVGWGQPFRCWTVRCSAVRPTSDARPHLRCCEECWLRPWSSNVRPAPLWVGQSFSGSAVDQPISPQLPLSSHFSL